MNETIKPRKWCSKKIGDEEVYKEFIDIYTAPSLWMPEWLPNALPTS